MLHPTCVGGNGRVLSVSWFGARWSQCKWLKGLATTDVTERYPYKTTLGRHRWDKAVARNGLINFFCYPVHAIRQAQRLLQVHESKPVGPMGWFFGTIYLFCEDASGVRSPAALIALPPIQMCGHPCGDGDSREWYRVECLPGGCDGQTGCCCPTIPPYIGRSKQEGSGTDN